MAADGTGITQEQKDQVLFFSLVQNFQQTAWIGLGKIADPMSQKAEVNLEMAQYAIDMLAMLGRKAQGNLSDPEARSLKEITHALRMNYVDVKSAEEKKASEAPEEQAGEGSANEPADEATEPASDAHATEEEGSGQS